LRVIAGRHRGRRLLAPPGPATRPTADRVRQALFDMLWHAPWAGRSAVEGAHVLDAFAGTGALGLEALSRGAAHATFLERDRAAIGVLRGNLATCGETERSLVLTVDATRPPAAAAGCTLVFLDPPYGMGLVASALPPLVAAGWIAPGALICAETEVPPPPSPPGLTQLAERVHGAAALQVFRA